MAGAGAGVGGPAGARMGGGFTEVSGSLFAFANGFVVA